MYVWVHECACLHVWRPDVKGKIDNSIIVVGKFNIFFSIMNRIPTKNKKTLNDTTDQLAGTDTQKALPTHSTTHIFKCM